MPSATTVWSPQIGDTSNVSATVISYSVLPAITASTTHTLAGAVPLTAQINVIAVAGASDAVALPSAATAIVGDSIVVINLGAAAAAVWPQAADKIDAASTGVAVVLGIGKRAIFYCVAPNQWYSIAGVATS